MAKPATRVLVVPKQQPRKWQTLLLHLQNATVDTFVLEFPDEAAAKKAAASISDAIYRTPTWFTLVHHRKGRERYLANLRNAQRVVIREE